MRTYKMVVLSPIIAPYQYTVNLQNIREILIKKYGDLGRHIDRAFDRWYINNRYVPVIHGATIYGAIKRAMNLSGKPFSNVKVFYAELKEDDITVMMRSIIVKGKQTVINYEILRSGAEAKVYGDLEMLRKKFGINELIVQIGGGRKLGYGLCKLILK